jgi:hypothetical protein
MRRYVLFGLAALGALGTVASVQCAPTEQTFRVTTTRALADLCAYSSSSDSMATAAQNFCEGYLVGAYQVLVQVDAARKKPAFCVVNPPTRQQAITSFVRWVDAHPSEGTRPPADGVFEFLTQQFPCPAKP